MRSDAQERHRQAVARSLERAQASADRGDFADALAWIEVVLAVDGALPSAWGRKHRAWQAASRNLASGQTSEEGASG